MAMTRLPAGLFLLLGLCAPAASLAQVAAPAAPRTIAAAPDRFFTHAGARLRYREAGRGQPVVLLHGYTQRIELMQDLADSLSGSFRVIVFDERGFGESSKFSDPARYGRAMVEDVIGLLDHLGIRRAHLVGHSMGALVAARAALAHPDRVASASLLAGPFFPDSAAFAQMSEPFVGALERGEGLVGFIKWIFPGIPDSLALAFNAQAMPTLDLGSLIASLKGMGGLTVSTGQHPARSIRVLIAVGTGDPLLPQSQALRTRWPAAQYVEVPGANHDQIRAHGATIAALRRVIQQRP
jgi:pimeloyl-ACP methyl ester carboxylesterase